MSPWLLALAVGIIVALIQYGVRDLRSGGQSMVAALLRIGAVTLLVALLLDAPAARARPVSTWAALDASLSMTRGDTAVWQAAGDTIRRAGAESVFVFGDSMRRRGATATPHDLSTQLRPAVERALGAGHPLVVVTDGEIDDPDAARGLPAGSRIVVLPHPVHRDLAVSSIDVPRAVVSGDSVEARVGVVAGSGGAHAGTLTVALEGRAIATSPIDSLAPFAERTIVVKSKLERAVDSSCHRRVGRRCGAAQRHCVGHDRSLTRSNGGFRFDVARFRCPIRTGCTSWLARHPDARLLSRRAG
jgi:hypothetical protein